MTFNLETVLFFIFGAAAIFTAIMMITRRSPVSSAIYLIINFAMVSGIYLLLKAQFIAIIQVLVYMGAIMVLFLFVIMLLNLKDEKKLIENFSYTKITAILFSIAMLGLMSMTVYFGFEKKYTELNLNAENIGKAEFLGKELFTTYSFPVIIAGILLTAAIIGAVVLAKKKFE
jgi:NADH-quinone oxidoreductase subunit J